MIKKKSNEVIKVWKKYRKEKINKKNNIKKNINSFLIILFFMISLILIITGCFLFSAGTHNVDLSHNFIIMECKENIDLVDYGSTYQTYDLEYYYITGFNQMLIGFLCFGYGCLIFGCVVVEYVK